MGIMSFLPIPDMVQGAYMGFAEKMHPLVSPKVKTSPVEAVTDENWKPETIALHVPEHYGEHWIPLSKQIVLHCPSKNVLVKGPMCSPVKFNVKSNWVEMFGNSNGIMGSTLSLLQSFSDFATMTSGLSARQPWMSRKNWKGTDPLRFSVEVNFVNEGTALDYAYNQMLKVLALVYPLRIPSQLKNNKDANKNVQSADMDASTFKGTLKLLGDVGKDLLTTAADLIAGDKYKAPGPVLGYQTTEDGHDIQGVNAGDPVIIYMGNYGVFPSCYIEQVGFECSKSLNMFGYPHYVKCTIEFSQADMSWAEQGDNGGCVVHFGQQMSSNSMAALTKTVANATGTYVKALAEGLDNVRDATGGKGVSFLPG